MTARTHDRNSAKSRFGSVGRGNHASTTERCITMQTRIEKDGTLTLTGIKVNLQSKEPSSTGKTYKCGYEKVKTDDGVTIAVNVFKSIKTNAPALV